MIIITQSMTYLMKNLAFIFVTLVENFIYNFMFIYYTHQVVHALEHRKHNNNRCYNYIQTTCNPSVAQTCDDESQ